MNGFQFPATLDGASRKKDKSVAVRLVSTFEMSPQDLMEIDTQVGMTGWALFRANEIQPADLPKIEAPSDAGRKTPAQRLRNTLYRVWETKTDKSEDFETVWYPQRMERIINHYKEQLV